MRRIVSNRRTVAFNTQVVGRWSRVLLSSKLNMSNRLHFLGRLAVFTGLLAFAVFAPAQNAASPGSFNYPIAGALPGDQTQPQAAIGGAGGYLVWQDKASDTNGLGVRYERLDAYLNK